MRSKENGDVVNFARRWRGGRFQPVLSILMLALLLIACAETGTETVGSAGSSLGEATPIASVGTPSPTSVATAIRAASPTSTRAAGGTIPASATVTAATTEPIVSTSTNSGGGGGKNEVRVVNRNDGQLQVRGNIDFNRIPGPTVEPVNLAYAYSSCTDCQTIAVALQINLISRTAARVTPQNAAVAVNEACLRCVTVARAIQYTYSVDDPTQTPPEITDLLREMDRTLREIGTEQGITVREAEARINAVIAQFKELAASLNDQRQEDTRSTGPGTPTVGPGATPTGGTATTTVTATIVATTTPAPTSPSPVPTPTATPTASPPPTTTPLPSATPTGSAP